MPSSNRRRTLGIVSIVLLATAAFTFLFLPEAQSVVAAGLRMGLATGVLWLAWPELARIPKWLYAVVVGVVIVVAVYPKVLFLAIPLIVAYAFLKPRLKGKR